LKIRGATAGLHGRAPTVMIHIYQV